MIAATRAIHDFCGKPQALFPEVVRLHRCRTGCVEWDSRSQYNHLRPFFTLGTRNRSQADMGRSGYYSKRDGDDEFDRQEWEQAQQKRAPTAPALGGDPSQTHPVSLEEWRSKPWKYKGYPAFSRWMASSNDFFLVRRFEQLNVRVLLFMQDRISEKEELLLTIDTCAQQSPDEVGNSGSLRDDPRQDRKDLLLELSHLLREYSASSGSIAHVREIRCGSRREADHRRQQTSIFHRIPRSAAGTMRKTTRSQTLKTGSAPTSAPSLSRSSSSSRRAET